MGYCTVAEVARALNDPRRATTEPEWLQACIDAAAAEIDHSIDAVAGAEPPADDPLANRVNILRAVEWAKANDAAFGVIGFTETGALQAPRDTFNRHRFTLTPLKQQYGVA